jgi:predicted DNA-binding transcriptional regulator AlpA
MANTDTGHAAGTFSTTSPDNRLLNERETANLLGLKVETLRRWRWAGKPPRFLKIGSAVRYEPAELAVFIEEARRTSTSDQGQGVA